MCHDNKDRKNPRTLLRWYCVNFWIFFFALYFCESFLRYEAAFIFFLFFRPSSSLVCCDPSIVLGAKAFLAEVSVKLAVNPLLCLHSYSFLLKVLEGFEHPPGKQVVLLLLK